MKKILITGKDSYVGTSVEKWLLNEPEKYIVNTIDMRNNNWRNVCFSDYDVVFHVAGIAHVSTDPKLESLYYNVNRDLTIEVAKKAKNEGIKQFIFMSSIIVYGDSNRVIDINTKPSPSNFYGKSKLMAEEGINEIATKEFKVVIVRPPMIYGKGSKGNYPKLSKLAKKIFVFPDVKNKRSMLHIDNLCEFIKLMINYEEAGMYFPQNKNYVNTSELVRTIAEIHGLKIYLTKIFNPFMKMLFKIKIMQKMFGNLVYEKAMSEYGNEDYQIRDFKSSIELTELGN